MKILQIIYGLSSGGAERLVVDLSNTFAGWGNAVSLVCLRDDAIKPWGFYKSQLSNQVNYHNLKIKPGFDPRIIIRLRKIIGQIDPDVVHVHSNLVNYVFPLAFFEKKRRYYYTVHNVAKFEVQNRLEYYIRKFFFRKYVHAITISNTNSASFTEYYNVNRFTQINNGRALPTITSKFSEVEEYINNFKKNGQTVFLNVARFSPEKNHQMLINVFNRLIKEKKKVVLLVIGGGFLSDAGKKLIQKASNGIYFLHEKYNIHDYMINSDAFCLSSIYEGAPIGIIEAFAGGCIPICTPVGGMIDLIQDGFTGYLSKSVSELDYYSKICEFLDANERVSSKSLIDLFNAKYQIDVCAKKHIQLYSREQSKSI